MDSWREIPGEEEGLKVKEVMESAWNVSLERGEQKTGYGRLEATWLQVRSSLVTHSIQHLTPTQPHTMRVFSILTTAASYFVRNQKGNVTAARNTTAPLPPRFLILQHLISNGEHAKLFSSTERLETPRGNRNGLPETLEQDHCLITNSPSHQP
ncbi:hypothetical protein BDV09DRAFT_191830 [Aspergillus tetrazonus]